MLQAATNGGSQSHSSVTAHCVGPSAARPSTVRPVCCHSAVCLPSPCCAARLPFRRISAWWSVSCSLALAVCATCCRRAQSDTNSQTADSATVTYKKVFKLFPVHPGPPRGEQCSSSVRALQSLGTYIRRLGRARTARRTGGRTARARGGVAYCTVQGDILHKCNCTCITRARNPGRDRFSRTIIMACPRRGRVVQLEKP